MQRQAAKKTKSKGYKRRFTFYVPRLAQSQPVITRQAIELELFKPSEDAGSLVDTIKIFGWFWILFFWDDIIGKVVLVF